MNDHASAAPGLSSRICRGALAVLRDDALAPGTTIGRFVILERLGSGGMGVVYAAYDPQLDRKIALKLLLSRGGGESEPQRLLREAQALARPAHPNVVNVHEVYADGERVWLAMEYVAGQTLGVWAERRRWSEVARALIETAHGVAAAHAAGVVHRDLKPDNVMIGGDGRARVTDFGLAHGRVVADDGEPAGHAGPDGWPSDGLLATRLTQTGAVLGTPAYMAPEQWRGEDAGPAADQFAWSVMAWELLYGERPFSGETMAELSASVSAGRRRPAPNRRRVPGWLRRAVERGLAPAPTERWPSMAALLAALRRGQTQARVRTVALGVAIVALLAAGIAGAWQLDVHRRRERAIAGCERAASVIDDTWNDHRREALRAGLLATGASFATTTADRTVVRLDAYADEWRSVQDHVCRMRDVEATWDPALAERAEVCLDERREGLASLVAIVSEPGRGADAVGVVQGAITAAATLPRIATCVDALRLQAAPAWPAEPAVRDEIRRLRGHLTRAAALAAVGRYRDALALATAVEQDAEPIDWAPLRAAASLHRGRNLAALAEYPAAALALESAHFLAGAAGEDEVYVDSAATLAPLMARELARRTEGTLWQRTTQTLLARGDVAADDLRRSSALRQAGHVALYLGAYEQARDAYARALEIERGHFDVDHPEVARGLQDLATAHSQKGEYDRALALFDEALAIQERALGPDHPDIAVTLRHAGVAYAAKKANESALLCFDRALAIVERMLGDRHPDAAFILNRMAGVYVDQAEYDHARELHTQALEIYQEVFGREHPEVAGTLFELAAVNKEQGRYADSVEVNLEALKIHEAVQGPDHPQVAKVLTNLGGTYNIMSRYVEAKDVLLRALVIKERVLGPGHPQVATTLSNLASSHMYLGEPDVALEYLERALKISEATLGPEHPRVAMLLDDIGLVHKRQGHYDLAIQHYLRAQPILERTLGPNHPDYAISLHNTGVAYHQLKSYDKAMSYHRRAVAIWERATHRLLVDGIMCMARTLVAQGDYAEFRVTVDHAVALLQAHGNDPEDVPAARFYAARVLWEHADERAEARRIASQARDGYRQAGAKYAAHLERVDAWLRSHRL